MSAKNLIRCSRCKTFKENIEENFLPEINKASNSRRTCSCCMTKEQKKKIKQDRNRIIKEEKEKFEAETGLRVCIKCGIAQLLTEEFCKLKSGKHQTICKSCDNLRNKIRYEEKRDEILENMRDKYPEVKDEKNRKKRDKYENDPEYRQRRKAKGAESYQKNKIKHKKSLADRRAKVASVVGSVSNMELSEIFIKQNCRCVYCNKNLSGEDKHLDHLFPLASFDSISSNSAHNIQWLCPKCNLRKHNKDPFIYEAEIGFLDDKRKEELTLIKEMIVEEMELRNKKAA